MIVNRPFQQGSLIRHVARHRLPVWAADIGATSWAQLLLKFIISHPAVTCVIPATTQVPHVVENVRAVQRPAARRRDARRGWRRTSSAL